MSDSHDPTALDPLGEMAIAIGGLSARVPGAWDVRASPSRAPMRCAAGALGFLGVLSFNTNASAKGGGVNPANTVVFGCPVRG
jgi:hypothetical protein